MIEKTATGVLDGATITRQSGRGRLVVVKGPDRGETIAIAEAPITIGSGGGSRRAAVGPDDLAQAPRHRARPGGAGAARPRLDQRLVRAGLALQGADAGLRHRGDDRQDGAQVPAPEEEVDLAPSEKESYGSLVGRDAKLRRLFALLDDVAATDATVLIEGETGTGKELIAEEIHRHSPRKDGPFVVFDCGAVPDELIESALFGHVRGAFTGAITDRPGAFEEADGGTLFLDEIGELAPGVQPALLRALDKQSVRPVGGSTYTRASRARRRRHQPQPARRDRGAPVPRGSLLPPRRRAHGRCRRCASAPTTSRCWSQHFMRQFRGDRMLEVAPEDLDAAAQAQLAGQRARAAQRDRTRLRASATASRLELDDALDDRPGAAAGVERAGASTSTCRSRKRRRASSRASSASTSRSCSSATRGTCRRRRAARRSIASTCASCCASTGCASRATRDMSAASWLAELRARAERLGREISGGVSGGVADSGHAAVYLRQLLRGNRAKRVLRSLRRGAPRRRATAPRRRRRAAAGAAHPRLPRDARLAAPAGAAT